MTAALQALLDEAAIRDLLARYCERLDEYDMPGVGACLAEHAVADYGPGRGGPLAGREAVLQRIAAGQSAFRRTHHQLGQVRIALLGSTADSLAYVTAWHEGFDGRREIVCLRYVDHLQRGSDAWLIARRVIEVAYVEGFPGVEWTWVRRQPPPGRG
jgi:SnoaL-like domain